MEERKLWAHHIKRLILENHHAIIPQKVRGHAHQCVASVCGVRVRLLLCCLFQAKDAILELNPTCE